MSAVKSFLSVVGFAALKLGVLSLTYSLFVRHGRLTCMQRVDESAA
jgi:hypothetical protein